MPLFGRGTHEPSAQQPRYDGKHRTRRDTVSTKQNTERNLRLLRQAEADVRAAQARRELGIQ